MNLAAESEGPDQTALMRRVIWAFVVRNMPEDTVSYSAAHLILRIVLAEAEQIIRIYRLIWVPRASSLLTDGIRSFSPWLNGVLQATKALMA